MLRVFQGCRERTSPSSRSYTVSQLHTHLPCSDSPCRQQPVTHTLESRAVGRNELHQIFSAHTHTSDICASVTHIKHIYHTKTPAFIAHNFTAHQSLTLSHSHTHTHVHTWMPGLAASVQFLNGPAVIVRLMVSQPPPSACISVHLSARPFSPSSEQQRSPRVVSVPLRLMAKPNRAAGQGAVFPE